MLYKSLKDTELKITPTCFGSYVIHHQGVQSCAWLKLLVVVHRYFVVCLVGVWQRNFEPVVCVYGTAVRPDRTHTHTHTPLKEAMGGKSFRSDESRPGMSGCALSPKTFFSRGIHALPKRWNTCVVRNRDYVEKWSHCVPFVFNKLQVKNI